MANEISVTGILKGHSDLPGVDPHLPIGTTSYYAVAIVDI